MYDRYAEELARRLPGEAREAYLREWQRAKQGESVAKVGMGYDASRDLLFRYEDGRMLAYVDWKGNLLPPPQDGSERADLDRASTVPGSPMEVPIFGSERINIGDFWMLPDALAAHYGLPREQRTAAFQATREYMARADVHLQLEPGQRAMLEALEAAGMRLIAMSNAPAWTVHDVVDKLGIRRYLSLVVAEAGKPLGLTRLLEESGRVLSVGDNYVNDIEPVVHGGGWGLYLDRHGTEAGAGFSTCKRVRSVEEARQWLLAVLASGADA